LLPPPLPAAGRCRQMLAPLRLDGVAALQFDGHPLN
jgi:hypothetical protein